MIKLDAADFSHRLYVSVNKSGSDSVKVSIIKLGRGDGRGGQQFMAKCSMQACTVETANGSFILDISIFTNQFLSS